MKLSDEQLKTTYHMDGPALVLAVPGAGKTTMLLYRTMQLIQNGINSDRILTITFSKSASLDMKSRFKKLFPNFKRELNFSTIHAFCYGIIREYSKLRGKTYRLIEENSISKFELLSKIYYEINKKTVTEENLEAIINKISYFKNTLLTPNETNTDIPNFVKLYNFYEQYKLKNGLIDFDDMITEALKILKTDDYIRAKYKNKFDYYQLDEGQDTSFAQFELIKYLCAPKNNIFIVADDDQSIYAFRGAEPNYLLNLNKIYKNLKTYYLQNNFRSSKNIVNTSNLFIKNNFNRFDKNIITQNDYLEPVNIIKLSTNDDEYNYIYDKITSEPLKSYAIIYRNNLSSLGLIEFLERKNISFNIKGAKLKFFSHFVVKDILLILEFSNNLSDIEIYSKIYYKLNGYISKKHIDYLKKNGGKNLFKTLLDYPLLPEYYRENIFKLMSEFKTLKNLDFKYQIEYILNELGYDHYLREYAKKFGFSYESLREFAHYLKYIATFEKNLDTLLARLKYLEHITNTPKNSKSNITISTIHSIKGLEFNTVFVIDLVEGVLPSNKSHLDDMLFEEERRLFYVAMTRAKNKLYLIYPKYHNNNECEISSFLTELSKL
ncbi:ATP-dependent helicase [Peptoniphilus sp. oral taxon 386]|uniref:ATP-dependent helicase n=1 Tax=Peptoniphilus sp. oral taxon 386 TaxID=652713 RepID=UPI0001DA9B35|nr:ATP-dependent helicase [Peptoniphilus sp. oral taxon 386]EFI42127.1 UvrD/REP helicase [Peptoniphilus sp. oral taxon 386 str. F0131]